MASEEIALMAHLMRRAGFGATREELEARASKGYEATVEELLDTGSTAEQDRSEMMRYHPWAWRPGTIQGMGAAEWMRSMLNTNEPLAEKMTPVLAPGVRHRRGPRWTTTTKSPTWSCCSGTKAWATTRSCCWSWPKPGNDFTGWTTAKTP